MGSLMNAIVMLGALSPGLSLFVFSVFVLLLVGPLVLGAVITSASAPERGMAPEQLLLQQVEPDQVGIATTLDGRPIEAGEIAGPVIPGHDNFQNAQAFIDGGGRRGLQEQILLSGAWNLNPWFAQVEQAPMVQIPIGYVGVVISFVGMAHA